MQKRLKVVNNKRRWMVFGIIAGMVLLLLIGKPSLSFSKTPNIVVIVSDSLRADYLGCYGGPAKTPNIDWLAKNGMKFNNAFSVGTWTGSASVAMLTGNYPTQYDVFRVTDNIHNSFSMTNTISAECILKKMRIENLYYFQRNHIVKLNYVFEGMHELAPIFTNKKWNDDFSEIVINEPFISVFWFLDPHFPYTPEKQKAMNIMGKYKNIRYPLSFYINEISLNGIGIHWKMMKFKCFVSFMLKRFNR